MKKLFVLTLVLFGTLTLSAQNKNARAVIDVDGVCGMCKARIEKAAIKTKGVKTAVWNVDTHELSLIYDDGKTDLKTIKMNIAAVGHDTKDIKATDEAYNSIDMCCRYRDESVVKSHKNKN